MKILDIFEVSYYRDDDKFECPDCRGKGWQTIFTQFGEDDYYKDMEECHTCDEKGYLTRKEVARAEFPRRILKDLKQITEAAYAFPGAKEIDFVDFDRLADSFDGLVLLGAGGSLEDWIKGVSSHLHEEGIASSSKPSEQWKDAYVLTTSGGRTDLALVFNDNGVLDVGKLAMWRLARGSDASWISDYVVNYKDQH